MIFQKLYMKVVFLICLSFGITLVAVHQQMPKTSNLKPTENPHQTQSPIIGVITQVLRDYKKFGPQKYFHLPSSYVKWIEMAGGRVLPILLNQEDEYYERVFNLTNGLLFPGGDNMIKPGSKTPMFEAANKLYKMAVESNDRGVFYPIWGTCLGFELLGVLSINKNTLSSCKSHDFMLPVEMVNRGRMFAENALANESPDVTKQMDYPRHVYEALQNYNLTYNYHKKCLFDDENYRENGLDKFFDILGYSYDTNNQKFIAIFEAKKYPFYGVQFHPEKPAFEVTHSPLVKALSHTKATIEVSRYFADFFINSAKRNTHKLSAESYEPKLIYNYSPRYTGINNDMYVQRYLWPFQNRTENTDFEFFDSDK